MHQSIHAIASYNVSPIVRIPDKQEWMVKRALDAGAHGIVVPLLNGTGDAVDIVQATKFPPQGRRGLGIPFTIGAFDRTGSLSPVDYLENANASLLTIVQIETRNALEKVSRILLESPETKRC